MVAPLRAHDNSTFFFAGDDAVVVVPFVEATPRASEKFVGLYRDAGGTVPPEEDEALIPLVRVRRALQVLRAPYDRNVDWNYQLCNLEAFHGLG